MVPQTIFDKAMHYSHYRELLEVLLAQGKTTGVNQSPAYLNYAKINLQRMQRLDKTVLLNDDLRAALAKLDRAYTWLGITEGWCGDAAQNLPVFHAIEKEFQNIKLRLILRDENPDIMVKYLTNGSRSIPKVICIDDVSKEERFVWGPRPALLQDMVMRMKQENRSSEEKGLMTQNWYNADKTRTLQSEILKLVQDL